MSIKFDYQTALSETIDYINNNQMTEWNYNGVVDIKEMLDFLKIAKKYKLSRRQRKQLTDETQELATKKLNSFDPTTGLEKPI